MALGALALVGCTEASDPFAGDAAPTQATIQNDPTFADATAGFEQVSNAGPALTAADCQNVPPGTFRGEDCERAGLADFGLVCALAVSGSPRADACEARGLGVTTPSELSPEAMSVFDDFRVAHDTLRAFELKVGAGLDPETAIADWPSISSETLLAKERALQALGRLEDREEITQCQPISDAIKDHIAGAVRWHRLYVKGESDRLKSFEEYGYVTDPGLDEIAQRFRNGVAELRLADQALLAMAQSDRCPVESPTGFFSS